MALCVTVAGLVFILWSESMLHLFSYSLVCIHRENYCSHSLSSAFPKVNMSSAIPQGASPCPPRSGGMTGC